MSRLGPARCFAAIGAVAAIALTTCAPAATRDATPPPHSVAATIDRFELQASLFRLADHGAQIMDRAVQQARLDSNDPSVLAQSTALRLAMASALADPAASQEPEVALAAIVRAVAAQRAVTGAEQADGAALLALEERVRTEARRWLSDDEWNALIEARDGSTVDLGARVHRPATEEGRSSEHAMLLAAHANFLLRRLPQVARWHADDAFAQAMDAPALQETLQRVDASRASIDHLSSALDNVQRTATTLEQRIAAIQPEDFSAAKDLATEVRGTFADAREALPHAERTITELREAISGAERVTAALRELTTEPDGSPVDLSGLSAASERFVTAAADLRAAMQQANQLLASDDSTQRLQDLAATGRATVDHVTFRIALLMVIAASLAVVLMVVRSLTRPRAETVQRAPRR